MSKECNKLDRISNISKSFSLIDIVMSCTTRIFFYRLSNLRMLAFILLPVPPASKTNPTSPKSGVSNSALPSTLEFNVMRLILSFNVTKAEVLHKALSNKISVNTWYTECFMLPTTIDNTHLRNSNSLLQHVTVEFNRNLT